jgi:hypothetical protein
MKKRNLAIKLDELPVRARTILPDELSKVFGGACTSYRGAACWYIEDCCAPLTCSESVPGTCGEGLQCGTCQPR